MSNGPDNYQLFHFLNQKNRNFPNNFLIHRNLGRGISSNSVVNMFNTNNNLESSIDSDSLYNFELEENETDNNVSDFADISDVDFDIHDDVSIEEFDQESDYDGSDLVQSVTIVDDESDDNSDNESDDELEQSNNCFENEFIQYLEPNHHRGIIVTYDRDQLPSPVLSPLLSPPESLPLSLPLSLPSLESLQSPLSLPSLESLQSPLSLPSLQLDESEYDSGHEPESDGEIEPEVEPEPEVEGESEQELESDIETGSVSAGRREELEAQESYREEELSESVSSSSSEDELPNNSIQVSYQIKDLDEVQMLRDSLAKTVKAKMETDEKCQGLQIQIILLTRQLEKAKLEASEAVKTKDCLIEDRDDLMENYEMLREDTEALNESLENSRMECEELREENRALLNEKHAIIEAKEAVIESLHDQNNTYLDTCRREVEKRGVVQSQFEKANERCLIKEREINKLLGNINQNQESQSSQNKRIEDLESTVSNLKRIHNRELTSAREEYKIGVDAIRDECAQTIKDKSAEVASLREEKKIAAREAENYRLESVSMEKQSTKTMKELVTTRDQLVMARLRLEQAQKTHAKEMAVLKREVKETLHSKTEAMGRMVQDRDREIASLQKNNRDYQRELNNCRLEVTGFQKLGLQQREKISRLEKQIDHMDRMEYGLDDETDTESEHGSESEKQSLEIGGESSQLVDRDEESKEVGGVVEELCDGVEEGAGDEKTEEGGDQTEKGDDQAEEGGDRTEVEKPKKGWFW